MDALQDDDVHWADVVLTSGLPIHVESMLEVIAPARAFQMPVLEHLARAKALFRTMAQANVLKEPLISLFASLSYRSNIRVDCWVYTDFTRERGSRPDLAIGAGSESNTAAELSATAVPRPRRASARVDADSRPAPRGLTRGTAE